MAIVEVVVCLLVREKQGREACLGRRAICKRDPSDCHFLVVRLGTGIIACPRAFVVTMGAMQVIRWASVYFAWLPARQPQKGLGTLVATLLLFKNLLKSNLSPVLLIVSLAPIVILRLARYCCY